LIKTISVGVVHVTEINTALWLNNTGLDNVILNDTNTFVDSVGLIDVGFPSVILNDTGTLIFSVGRMTSST
jgi:hypothetical protein